MHRGSIMLLFAVVSVAEASRPTGEVFKRSPWHYVMRFGHPDAELESGHWSFRHPGTEGFTEVQGRFSVRWFHDKEVTIEAVFYQPHLDLAGVTITRSRGWPRVAIDALLADHGGRWRQLGAEAWTSEEGVRAIRHGGTFHLVGPRIVGEMDRVRGF